MKINISFKVVGDMIDNPSVSVKVLEELIKRIKREDCSIEVGHKIAIRDFEGNQIGAYEVVSENYRPTDDELMSADELRAKYGRGGHPEHTIEDWMEDVKDGDTKLGYWDWVVNILEPDD
jgi:hypothetical protein